jgi:hypothetical protein
VTATLIPPIFRRVLTRPSGGFPPFHGSKVTELAIDIFVEWLGVGLGAEIQVYAFRRLEEIRGFEALSLMHRQALYATKPAASESMLCQMIHNGGAGAGEAAENVGAHLFWTYVVGHPGGLHALNQISPEDADFYAVRSWTDRMCEACGGPSETLGADAYTDDAGESHTFRYHWRCTRCDKRDSISRDELLEIKLAPRPGGTP